MSTYIEIKITVGNKEQQEILLARLAAAGANGFQEEKDMLKAFVAAEMYDEPLFTSILQEQGVAFQVAEIKETNWNAEWEAGFEPVRIGHFCAIRAGFHPPITDVQYEIVITPKMSFGTGHHGTTHMMMAAMEQLPVKGASVFDFGTGTGVLAILAEKMGAASIAAIDNDDWSIANAMENFNANNCSKILLIKQETIVSDDAYNIILANINRHIILEQLPVIQQHLLPGGVVLFSGLLTGDKPLVLEKAGLHQLALVQEWEMNGWICLLMVNHQ